MKVCLIDSLALHPVGRGHRPLALPLGLRADLLHHERAQTAQLRPQPARHLLQESEGGILRLLLPAAAAAATDFLAGDLTTAGGAEDVRLGARSLNDSLLIFFHSSGRPFLYPTNHVSPFASR